ncbi:hypothetical protein [Rickettsia endosymbiont of Polydrusus tereticollis]|uniref:hypothetical protein n=1 Tax=Rickettsia endosymbiont of Polydrusus tereticollis TaxID=3066251 RepID=UPI003132B46C
MANHNNLAGTHKQTTPLNNTSSASEKRILVSTISNALFKESNINNNNQGTQNNSIYPENNFNNIIDADDHNTGYGMCDCLGVIATVCCNILLFLCE